ncbi:MAG: hypothetical protein GY820_38650 [Gammaproteobacteria bacterium]|nr:hypothetical protein [Gammaproteobacteria bacterium]
MSIMTLYVVIVGMERLMNHNCAGNSRQREPALIDVQYAVLVYWNPADENKG